MEKLELGEIIVKSYPMRPADFRGGNITTQLTCIGGFTCERETNCETIWNEWYGNQNGCIPQTEPADP